VPKRTFYGKITDGKLVLDDRNLMNEFIKRSKDMDIELTISPASKDPSVRQWGYLYSSVYREFALYTGYTIDEVDGAMKKQFMVDNHIVLPEGFTLTKTAFDKVWLARYVDACIRICAEHGVAVPPPKVDFNQESTNE
jgi:hypothetical protein